MPEIRIKDIDEHEIDTILAEDIDFEGHLTFKKPLMVKGKFKGEIKSSSSLHIGEKAYVEARIEASVVSSKGRIKGDILGHSRVELLSTSQLEGDVTTPDFVVESGCKFNGLCNMGGGAHRKEGQGQQPAGHVASSLAGQSGGNSGQGSQHQERNGAAPHDKAQQQGQQGTGQQQQGQHQQGQQPPGQQQGQQPGQQKPQTPQGGGRQ